MSSHHIVRDEQEPALLILTDKWDADLVGNLLEWSPTVIVDADLAESISKQPFKVDIVIGTEEQLGHAKNVFQHQEPIKYISKKQNEETLLQAFYFLSAAKYRAVNVLTMFVNKIIENSTSYPSNFTVVLYDQEFKWYCVKQFVFKKWLPKGQRITFIDNSTPVKIINAERIDNFWRVEEDGIVELEMPQNSFWLGEAI